MCVVWHPWNSGQVGYVNGALIWYLCHVSWNRVGWILKFGDFGDTPLSNEFGIFEDEESAKAVADQMTQQMWTEGWGEDWQLKPEEEQ